MRRAARGGSWSLAEKWGARGEQSAPKGRAKRSPRTEDGEAVRNQMTTSERSELVIAAVRAELLLELHRAAGHRADVDLVGAVGLAAELVVAVPGDALGLDAGEGA